MSTITLGDKRRRQAVRNSTTTTRALWLALMVCAAVLALPMDTSAGARITIINGNLPGVGFNDPTPVVPVGGNPGTTLGQQRLIAFQFAADLWGATLDSNVEIRVLAQFTPLGPNVLGSAGTTYILDNFPGSPGFPGAQFPDTWYHSALADKRAGRDVLEDFDLEGEPDIVANFSSDFNFYLGLDNNHGALNDLVVVVLHELSHGLGFANFVSETSGSNASGLTDVYSQFTLDTTTNTRWAQIDPTASGNVARAASALRVDKIVWDGEAVTAAVPSVLSFGRAEINVNSPAGIAGAYRVGTASGFGPPLSSPGITNDVVLVNDGLGVTSDGCTALVNAAQVAGKIALADRGTCTFVQKALVAQAAGALALIIANNAAGDPPPALGGVDPTVTISSVSISIGLGTAIKAQLPGVNVTLGLDLTQRAGADPGDLAQLFATNPVQPGSSISHWDSIAFRNQLMEPAINPDLTHEVIPPIDMTLPQLRDVGWFLDANLDGEEDATVVLGTCDTHTPNVLLSTGATLADQARVWFRDCGRTARNTGQFVSCVSHATNDAKASGLITGAQKGAIQSCAAKFTR